MKKETLQVLTNLVEGELLVSAIWKNVMDDIFYDFKHFIGWECSCDLEPWVDPSSPSFSFWVWSDPAKNLSTPLTLEWTCVIYGEMVEDRGISIAANLFLFHDNSRLCTSEGESYIQFAFENPEKGSEGWRCFGWTPDEYGEWEDVLPPEQRR